jgi:hypothetical protein
MGNALPMAALDRETSVAAVAAQAKAAVEARYVMAMQQPRDIDVFRQNLLHDCKRPGFARVARYAKPVGGKKIEGPSVRFVETALRHFRNILRETPTIYEDDEKRIVRVIVTDLEANVTHSTDVPIAKTVERRKVKDGQEVLGQRENSYGDTVYIVRATDDDLLNKTNALISKAVRNMGLNVLPGDIVEEAQELVQRTARDEDAKDPDAARKKIVDSFATLGVRASDLTEYLGHSIDQCSPAEMDDLRAVYAGLKEGETTWVEVAKTRAEQSSDARAAERSKDTLDANDLARLTAQAAEAGKASETPVEIVIADVLGLDDPGDAAMALSGVAKADLPKIARAIKAWAPKAA